jgi:two-component system response regulator YesN
MSDLIKVFLCEDEFIIRQAIKKTINWEREGYELAGEAGDGETAFPLISETKPDILITDIRMPFMDGLELSRLVRRSFPKMKIVILSGYDDFSYAKEAISIGVTDYLLKPITEKKLLESLGKVRQQLLEEQDHEHLRAVYEREQEEKRQFERQAVLREVMNGHYTMADAVAKGKAVGMDLLSPWYGVTLFQFRSVDEKRDQSAYDETNSSIHDRIMQVMETFSRGYMYEQIGDIQSLLVMGATEEETLASEKKLAGQLMGLLGDHPHHLCFAAVGRPVSRIRELGDAYQRISRVFSRRFLCTESRLFYECESEELSAGRHSAGAEGQAQNETIDIGTLDIGRLDHHVMISFFSTGTAEDIESFTNEYFDSLGEINMASTILRQYVVMDVVFCATSFLESIGLTKEEVQERFNAFQKDMISGSPEQAKEFLNRVFREVISQRTRKSEQKYADMIAAAKAYIRQNYANENISLKSTAANVGFSPNHFSGIFSQETGQTFIEYLTDVRMERAKELLRSTPMKTSEIGFEVGYHDPHYFSYIFKKTQNVTPKEYRSAGG